LVNKGGHSHIRFSKLRNKITQPIVLFLVLCVAATFNIVGCNDPEGTGTLLGSGENTFVYVANSGSDDVSVIDGATNTVKDTITGLNQPSAVVVSPDGSTLYVSNQESNSVSVIDIAKKSIVHTLDLTKGVLYSPTSLAISPDGLHFICNIGIYH
jgi:YVTN family beta-propeller protein